jgi:hypothetical protein
MPELNEQQLRGWLGDLLYDELDAWMGKDNERAQRNFNRQIDHINEKLDRLRQQGPLANQQAEARRLQRIAEFEEDLATAQSDMADLQNLTIAEYLKGFLISIDVGKFQGEEEERVKKQMNENFNASVVARKNRYKENPGG